EVYSFLSLRAFFFKLSKNGISGFFFVDLSKLLIFERKSKRIFSAPDNSRVFTFFKISFEKLLTSDWLPTAYCTISEVEYKFIFLLYSSIFFFSLAVISTYSYFLYLFSSVVIWLFFDLSF